MARPIEHKPETILAAACTLFHREGVGVSTARIAAEAGVSNGTLFNYFATKQALIDALYLSIKTDLSQAIDTPDDAEPLAAQMRQIWDRWLAWARQNPERHHVVRLLNGARLASEQAQLDAMAMLHVPVNLLHQAHAHGVLVDLPVDYLGGLIEQQLDSAVLADFDPAQDDIAFAVLWNGISSPTPKKESP